MELEPLAERLELVTRHIERAATAVAEDGGASPVLLAVVRELARKAGKARGLLEEHTHVREAVVELEQAADSARVAAQADGGATEATREAVELAHQAICLLKAEQGR